MLASDLLHLGWTEALEGAGQLPAGQRQQRESHKYEVRSMSSTDSSIGNDSVYPSANTASVFREIRHAGEVLRL